MGTRHGRSTPKETACSSRIVGGVGGLRAVYVLAWAALAGCAQAPSAVPPSGSGAPVDGVGVTGEPETWDDVLAVEAERLGIDDPPDVVPIRYVTPQEADRYYHECMAEQGWKAEPDGSYVSTEEQAEAINLSDYVCLASYPIPAEYLQPLTDDQWAYLYDYWIETTLPCFAEHGLEVRDVPSRATFLGAPYNWNPISAVSDHEVETKVVQAGKAESVNDFFATVCPGPDPEVLRRGP